MMLSVRGQEYASVGIESAEYIDPEKEPYNAQTNPNGGVGFAAAENVVNSTTIRKIRRRLISPSVYYARLHSKLHQ